MQKWIVRTTCPEGNEVCVAAKPYTGGSAS